MSGSIIKDGTGSSYSAKVNSENKLMTLSVSESIAAHHAFEGTAYNINTGTISLSSANASALLYLKNNEDNDVVITAIFYLLGTNTGGSGDTLVEVLRNPTAGTLVSSGTAFSAINRDFGSSNTLDVDLLKGVEGSTLTDGSVAIESLLTSSGRSVISVGAILIPRGSSVGIRMTPSTGTSAQDVQMAMAVYLAKELTI